MMCQENLLRYKFQKTSLTGIMLQDCVFPLMITVLDEIGYDFVVLDQEHGPSTTQQIQDCILTAQNLNIAILVRPRIIKYEFLAHILDMGADGLMIPHVESLEQLETIVKSCRYPPQGQRSYGMRKELPRFKGWESSREYIEAANQNIALVIQIESPEAMTQREAFLSHPEIDGVIVGPADYTMNMGIIGEYQNVEFEAHLTKILETAQETHKGMGCHFGDLNLTQQWAEKGMNILLHSNEWGLLKQAGQQVQQKLNRKLKHEDASIQLDPY